MITVAPGGVQMCHGRVTAIGNKLSESVTNQYRNFRALLRFSEGVDNF